MVGNAKIRVLMQPKLTLYTLCFSVSDLLRSLCTFIGEKNIIYLESADNITVHKHLRKEAFAPQLYETLCFGKIKFGMKINPVCHPRSLRKHQSPDRAGHFYKLEAPIHLLKWILNHCVLPFKVGHHQWGVQIWGFLFKFCHFFPPSILPS